MPVPLAVVAFCITSAACHDKRKRLKGDQFVNEPKCALFVQDHSYPFMVGALNMSKFIESSISGLPSVTGVSVKTENNRVQVEVTVDAFDWKNLQPIYEKELDLSYAFRDQYLDFRVIDGSPYARETARTD
jgi:hypothetical protein